MPVAHAVTVAVALPRIGSAIVLVQVTESVIIQITRSGDIGRQIDLGAAKRTAGAIVEEAVIVIVDRVGQVRLGRGPGIKRASHLVINHAVTVGIESVEAFVDIDQVDSLPPIRQPVAVVVVDAAHGLGANRHYPVGCAVSRCRIEHAVMLGHQFVLNGIEILTGILMREVFNVLARIVKAEISQRTCGARRNHDVAESFDLGYGPSTVPDADLVHQAVHQAFAINVEPGAADVHVTGADRRSLHAHRAELQHTVQVEAEALGLRVPDTGHVPPLAGRKLRHRSGTCPIFSAVRCVKGDVWPGVVETDGHRVLALNLVRHNGPGGVGGHLDPSLERPRRAVQDKILVRVRQTNASPGLGSGRHGRCHGAKIKTVGRRKHTAVDMRHAVQRTGQILNRRRVHLDVVIDPVIIGVLAFGMRAELVLLLQVRKRVTVGVVLRITQSGVGGEGQQRLGLRKVLVEVGQPVTVRILIAVGNQRIRAVLNLPRIRHAVTVHIDIRYDRTLSDLDERSLAEQRPGVTPVGVPVTRGGLDVVLRLTHLAADFGPVGIIAGPILVGPGIAGRLIVKPVIRDQTGFSSVQDRLHLLREADVRQRRIPNPNLVDETIVVLADTCINRAGCLGNGIPGTGEGPEQLAVDVQLEGVGSSVEAGCYVSPSHAIRKKRRGRGNRDGAAKRVSVVSLNLALIPNVFEDPNSVVDQDIAGVGAHHALQHRAALGIGPDPRFDGPLGQGEANLKRQFNVTAGSPVELDGTGHHRAVAVHRIGAFDNFGGIREAVVVGVNHQRMARPDLFLGVAEGIAVGILVTVMDPVGVGIVVQRIRADEVFVIVSQAIAILVLGSV